MHRDSASPDGMFGLARDNYLGSQPQTNTPRRSWTDFYRDHRLLPQIARAKTLGLLPSGREQALRRVVERSDTLLADLPASPVLVHGDLWSGNFLSAGEEPVILDPAVYYADREVEMAYVELFGGFPAGLMPAYQAAWPLDSGYGF